MLLMQIKSAAKARLVRQRRNAAVACDVALA
jgi:hypothetical protein